MPVRLNGTMLRNLIDAAGGMDAFLDHWHVSSTLGLDHINKATVHRWINGQLPKNPERLLRLAAALDVDPFAILATDAGRMPDAADEMLEIAQGNRSVPPALQFLRPFFGRRQFWPPDLPRLDGGQRPWHVREFEHEPNVRCNFYQAVELQTQDRKDVFRPQLFHFAFRHPRMFGARWLQYGTVLRCGLRCALWHINGYTEELTLHAHTEPTTVRTWFGPGPATFSVASLHPFTLASGQLDHERSVLTFPG